METRSSHHNGAPDRRDTIVRTPLFPLYSEVRTLLSILDDEIKATVTSMIQSIWAQTGTPQNPVDWSDPDQWISERLKDDEARLAQRIWSGSGRTVNPRHMYGAYLFINGFDLLVPDINGNYQITQRGDAFRREDSDVIREIDEAEGLPQLLGILATKTRAKRADIVPEWGDFLREYSNYGTDSTIKDTLRRRLLNLIERGFVTREGNTYIISDKGLDYAAPIAQTNNVPSNERQAVTQAIGHYNEAQIERLSTLLSKMPPYQFEHLVRDLLEAMGYEDVTVTKESGDRGVDVVARVQFGITTITEVVQVKRHQGSITRPTIDQLRGALVYHGAIRGTIITTGRFSSGCADAALYPNAAPITLIDGDRLLDLLVENAIGIRKRPATLYEIDTDAFPQPDTIEGASTEAEIFLRGQSTVTPTE